MKPSLPFGKQVSYAVGALGYSTMYNIISVMLIYFYLPPEGSGLSELVPNGVYLGVLTGLAMVVAAGRLSDAITDPLIAFWSDRHKGKNGRRIPFMRWSILPTSIFCILIFVPSQTIQSTQNLWWLASMLFCFFISMTFYLVPYTALLPELARTRNEKIQFSAYISMGYVGGIILASLTPMIADVFEAMGFLESRLQAIQWAIGLLSILGGICLFIPAWTISEQKYCDSTPISIPFKDAFLHTIKHKNFRLFIGMELLYFMSLSIVVSGLMYYLTVLLGLPEARGAAVMGVMVLVSLLFYPMVVKVSKKSGYKKMILSGLCVLGALMGAIFFMGKVPVSPNFQIFSFAVFASYPLAVLGILPHAIIAEISDLDAKKTGEQKEGMFYAIRNFSTKLGQTLGLFIFALLTLLGKDPNHDWGIRLSGVIGMGLCLLAIFIFWGFREDQKDFDHST